jgi:hypothetical protein
MPAILPADREAYHQSYQRLIPKREGYHRMSAIGGKPAAIFRCRVRPYDAADVPVAVEHVVVVVRPLAARAGF